MTGVWGQFFCVKDLLCTKDITIKNTINSTHCPASYDFRVWSYEKGAKESLLLTANALGPIS